MLYILLLARLVEEAVLTELCSVVIHPYFKCTIMKSFQEVIQSDKPVLVDFFAEWCGPCKMMPPILKEVKNQLQDEVIILKIDIDKNPHVASSYNIQSVPTLVVFKKGEILWRQSGVPNALQLKNVLKQCSSGVQLS